MLLRRRATRRTSWRTGGAPVPNGYRPNKTHRSGDDADGASVPGAWSGPPEDGSSHTHPSRETSRCLTTFALPGPTTFRRLEELGLHGTGQQLEPHPAVPACRVPPIRTGGATMRLRWRGPRQRHPLARPRRLGWLQTTLLVGGAATSARAATRLALGVLGWHVHDNRLIGGSPPMAEGRRPVL